MHGLEDRTRGWASGTPGYSVHYGYDLRNLQTFARFGSASGAGIATAYDGLGRPASSANTMGGVSRTLSYQYDAAGRRTRLTFPDGQYLTYQHDGLGNLTAIHDSAGAEVATFSYDAAGRPAGRASAGTSTSYGWDPASRLASLGHDLGGASADQGWGFTYNPASQIRTRTSANDAYASNTAYAVSRPYSVNGLNQYTAAGPATFRYDANGNLDFDGSTVFGYDAENRLTGSAGQHSSRLQYDPLGRLFQTSDFAGGGVTQFLWDGDELVAEYDAAGAMQVRYVHGLGADDPIGSYAGAGMAYRRQYFADHQGSMVAVTDGAGTPLLVNAFDAWGIPNPQNQGRFGYTGQIWIPELGMWHYKARIYSPTLGRFMQTDPVGYDDQINLYAYVGNDPVNLTDPTGQQAGATIVLCPLTGPAAPACVQAHVAGAIVVGAGVASQGARGDRDNIPTLGGNQAPSGRRRPYLGHNGGPPLDDPPSGQMAAPLTDTDRIIRDQLNPRTLQAARDEMRGRPLPHSRSDGAPWDHVTKVRNGQQALRNRIEAINRRLGHPRVEDEERLRLARELSRASRHLDESRRYVP